MQPQISMPPGDDRIVMTLDAGGTNFVFSAMQANRPVVPSFALPSNADNLQRSLDNIAAGFRRVQGQLPTRITSTGSS
jgi:glucokinase